MPTYQMHALEELFLHRYLVLTFEIRVLPCHNILDVTALVMVSDIHKFCISVMSRLLHLSAVCVLKVGSLFADIFILGSSLSCNVTQQSPIVTDECEQRPVVSY
jgi:hypothetical protein